MHQGKQAAENKLTQTVKRVNHDIHSPLVSMEMVLRDAHDIPESKRIILHNAIGTIKSILSNLSISYYLNEKNKTHNESGSQLISHLLESIISEKRLQYIDKDIAFDYSINNQASHLFVDIEVFHFTRVISNIIHNAVEATTHQGHLKIVLDQRHKYISIKIIDTGCGIPPQELPQIFYEGKSFGKRNGSGMGLTIVKEYVEKWRGTCKITSSVGLGTTVTISLPIAKKPCWFQSKLVLLKQNTVVVLDDDVSIHAIWGQRLNQWLENKDIKLVCYRHIDELKNHIADKQDHKDRTCYYLIDYEISNSSITGIELIKQYQLNDLALLVTNYGGESKIHQACLDHRIKMIPKNYAMKIPIEVIDASPDLVLLDNNESILAAWKFVAKQRDQCIATFSDIEDFKVYIKACHKKMNIYVDYDLDDECKGDQLLKELFSKKYHNLYLLTGYDSHMFPDMPWIKAILPKHYPL